MTEKHALLMETVGMGRNVEHVASMKYANMTAAVRKDAHWTVVQVLVQRGEVVRKDSIANRMDRAQRIIVRTETTSTVTSFE